MPRRQRWTPVKGTGTRVASPVERVLLSAADLPLRALRPRAGRSTRLRSAPTACARSSSCASTASATC